MPNLTAEQLAEGRRLLEAYLKSHSTCRDGNISLDFLRAKDAWHGWLHEHGARLLAPQVSAAEFAQAAADIDAALTPYFQALTRFVDSPSANADERFVAVCEQLEAARSKLRELAAQHGIELTAAPDGPAERESND